MNAEKGGCCDACDEKASLVVPSPVPDDFLSVVWHEHYRNHDYNPDSCSGCQRTREALIAYEKREGRR